MVEPDPPCVCAGVLTFLFFFSLCVCMCMCVCVCVRVCACVRVLVGSDENNFSESLAPNSFELINELKLRKTRFQKTRDFFFAASAAKF